MNKRTSSWLVVGILLYLFFPVGIWMLVRKVKGEKHRCRENGKALKILSWVLFVVAGCCLFTGIMDVLEFQNATMEVGILLPCLLLIGGGVWSLKEGQKLTKLGERIDLYELQFEQAGVLDLDPVAAELKIPYEKLVSDLKEMIDEGYVDNAFIDLSARCLTQKVRRSRTYVVNCPHCGGTSEIPKGENAVCSYCGSAL